MSSIDAELPEVYIQPGESRLIRNPAVLRTVLGSCVGITFWSEEHGAAALCHPMLPVCPESADIRTNPQSARRYVDYSIRDLARQFDELGVSRRDIEVKLFGGANVLSFGDGTSSRPTIGEQNLETAIRVLRDEGFEVVASSFGGCAGITIQFHTVTGEVFLRRLS